MYLLSAHHSCGGVALCQHILEYVVKLCRFPWRRKQLSTGEHLAFEVSNMPLEPSVLSVLHLQQYHMGIAEMGAIPNYFHHNIAG